MKHDSEQTEDPYVEEIAETLKKIDAEAFPPSTEKAGVGGGE